MHTKNYIFYININILQADNTFDTITTPPDGIQQWYLDVKNDDGGNLGSGQESIKGLVKENPITAKRYMTITEEWIVRESITVVDKMRPIDKNTKSTNLDSPKNIISTTITEQEASGSGIQTVEKTKNSGNSTLSNVKESTINYRQTTETDMNTSFTNDKSITTGQKPTDTGMKITNTNEKSTNTDVEFSNTNENTRITEKKTTDIGIGVNKSNAVDKAKQSDNNRPTTAEKLTTSDKKTIGVNTSFINEKSTTIGQKPTGTGVKMTKTNEKSTNTDVDSSDTDENMTNTYMKIPDYVEESITIDKKPINISIQTSTRIKESITFEKKGNLADKMVTKDDWKTLTTEKQPIQTDKMTQTTEENNIKTNQKTSDTEKKPINTNKTNADTEKKSIKSIKKTPNNVEKTKKMDKKPPTTTNKKTPTTADQKTRTTTDKKSTSIAKKTPITAEKLIITSDKKRIFICTKRFANEEQSYTNWPSPCFSELKLTSVDAERCTNDCNTFEKEKWSGNYVMTHRRSAKESQPTNTLELHSCSSAEYFPNTVLQRRGNIIYVVISNSVLTDMRVSRSKELSAADNADEIYLFVIIVSFKRRLSGRDSSKELRPTQRIRVFYGERADV